MEEIKTSPRPRRRLDSVGSTSSNVIDLRQSGSKTIAPGPRAVKPAPKAAKPALKPAPKKKPPLAPVATAPAIPTAAEAFDEEPLIELDEKDLKPSEEGTADDMTDLAVKEQPQRRFWPAFWRFLFLLIVLGALIGAGYYFYMAYFAG